MHFSWADAHRRCAVLLAAAEQALVCGEWAAFRARLVEFRSALLAHFALEEDLLPEFERRSGLQDAAAQLRAQHRSMREILDTLVAVSPAHDPAGCAAELAAFGLMYAQHAESEESLLYPVLGRAPDPDRPHAASSAAVVMDLRGLEPPQPIVRIFEALERASGEPLLVVLPHEPHPLYGLLREHGFECAGAQRADGGFELTIRKAS